MVRSNSVLSASDSQSAVADPTEDVVDRGEGGTAHTTERKAATERREKRKQQPRYHVILWDDNDHSYDYVIRMLQELFGYSYTKGYLLAREVDKAGRTVCLTTTLEHAELKRDQIHAFGKDQRIASSAGSMSCTLEPAE